MNKLLNYLIWVLFFIPVIYLASIWRALPERVPMHYNLEGEVDRFGTKSEFIFLIALVTVVNIGVYFLLINVHRIDPKKRYSRENLPAMKKLAFAISVFLTAIACFIIYTTRNAEVKFNSNLIVVALGLLFTVMGNYFRSIKPNYFAGIRTPWALENEDNWRQTHKLGSRLWFGGGLAVIAVGLLLDNAALFVAMMAIILVLVIVPIAHSYRLYARTKKSIDK